MAGFLPRRFPKAVPTAEVLTEARDIISFPDRWTTGTGARNSLGGMVPCFSPDACRWCMLGAIAHVAHRRGLHYSAMLRPYIVVVDGEAVPEFFAGQRDLMRSLDLLSLRLFGLERAQDVNDKRGRLAAISLIDAALDELRAAA